MIHKEKVCWVSSLFLTFIGFILKVIEEVRLINFSIVLSFFRIPFLKPPASKSNLRETCICPAAVSVSNIWESRFDDFDFYWTLLLSGDWTLEQWKRKIAGTSAGHRIRDIMWQEPEFGTTGNSNRDIFILPVKNHLQF